MGGEQVVQIRHLHGRGTGCSNQTPLWDQRLFKSDTSMGGEQVVQIRHLHGRGTGCSNQTPPWEGNRLFKPDASMGGEQVKLSWCMDHLLLKQPTSVPASIAPPGNHLLKHATSMAASTTLCIKLPCGDHPLLRQPTSAASIASQVNRPCADHPLLKQATSMASSTAFCVKVAC